MNSNPSTECRDIIRHSVDASIPEESSEEFSIESLLQRVDEFQKREQLETIERLTTENSLLKENIARYQEGWCATVNLLREAYETVVLIQGAIKRYCHEETTAERDWLAFWGIQRESTENLGYLPEGWI